MSDTTDGQVLTTQDGKPLKAALRRALRREKLRAFLLIAPLLIFVLITFVAPIVDMLFRSVENQIVSDTLPRTVASLDGWDAQSDAPPGNGFDWVIAVHPHPPMSTRAYQELLEALTQRVARAWEKRLLRDTLRTKRHDAES